jgi:hypothetical protein
MAGSGAGGSTATPGGRTHTQIPLVDQAETFFHFSLMKPDKPVGTDGFVFETAAFLADGTATLEPLRIKKGSHE